jgi:hypothetical protein
MKNGNFSICLILIAVILLFGCSEGDDVVFPKLQGPYLGQKPPGMTPELFAPGLLSAGGDEADITFTPDAMEMCYTLWTPVGENLPDHKWPFHQMVIMHTRVTGGNWTEPEELPFPSDRKACYPFFSPDEDKLFFASFSSGRSRLMVSGKSAGMWTVPEEINEMHGAFISVAEGGRLYFSSGSQIATCRYSDGSCVSPEVLSHIANEVGGAHHLYVAPNESFLIFDYDLAPDSYGEEDLYISFRRPDGLWTRAVNMGFGINTPFRDKRAFVSFDGRYLFFSSNRFEQSGMPEEALSLTELRELTAVHADSHEHIYWVDAGVIDALRSDCLARNQP